MGAIMGSLADKLIKAAIYAVIAWAGITCGKNWKASKSAKEAAEKNSTN